MSRHPAPDVPDGAGAARPPGVVPALLVLAAVTSPVGALVLDAMTTDAERAAATTGRGTVVAVTGAALLLAAAAVLRARPRHGVGLVLAAFGLVWAVDGLMESWAAHSLAHGLPGTGAALWFVARFGAVLVVGLPLLLVLYPTGRLMPGRWGAVSLTVVLAACVLPVGLLVAPDDVVFAGAPRVPGVRTDALALPLPDAAAVALLTVARPLALLSLVGALVVVVVRHRRAGPDERRRLRWLLWAGLVCVVAVGVLGLVPAGSLTSAVLALTVVLTAASVAVGIVRPDLADVDALVAGTVTYAGVAAVVVALDVAAVAAADAVLGERMEEREVAILVLLVALAVYGPVRARVGALVRRSLVGRRGDRYDVVTTVAARLERAGSVSEQLPLLTEAVASAFRVPYVAVEVLLPGGAAVSADHGTRTGEVREVEIAYRGERIGRLVLPDRGVRSLLSRRDQDLLVDLVRQAAIALRSSMLADALQESRERLVLAREEDRRRIRRDLHDGLGPVLGGVALRLDAAGNAIATDPDRAADQVRRARTEIREALGDVRRLVHDLRPPALDDLGLAAAVEQLAERVRGVLAVDVTTEGVESLPAAVEVAAYRIVAEALTNATKHAAATRCHVSVVVADGVARVAVRDDGRGIEADVRAGVGLLSMRERAEELGGRCEVTCPPEGGTLVRASLPMADGEHR